MKVDVLGTEYDVVLSDKSILGELADGECDFYSKTIRVLPNYQMLNGENTKEARNERFNQVVKHEIFHAFLFESGLSDYAYDETLVDWFSLQFEKMENAIKFTLDNFDL